MVFYILFFASGFMGGAALVLMRIRLRNRLLSYLLSIQALFLLGMALVMFIYYFQSMPGDHDEGVIGLLLFLATGTNTALWVLVLLLMRRMLPPPSLPRAPAILGQFFVSLVILKSAANMGMVFLAGSSGGGIIALTGVRGWNLAGHLLTALAMASFGLLAIRSVNAKEPAALRSLLKAYGLCTLVFAPAGFLESLIQSAGIDWLAAFSLDHLYYLAWNMVSMSAAMRLFRSVGEGSGIMEAVPPERVQALGLSPREAEIAVMIAHGLANKEIAHRLFISPATVRTHIYNLYQKAGARSRVELLNKLRS
ncbi:helix-turn-helix transcriptional regulator [Marispirochaeta aestuarii]|uniref:helix-turn-helix domain-containing protein n=1 Tax=Marispirochaeta aestuarii TaxID=1963862 RepID=UPI0029C62DE6|nr:helix-turn-helix transcriptional regulator [Marispirochaeta aestuarii]